MSVEANVEFDRIQPEGLRQVPVVAQALDNHWLSAAELRGIWDGSTSQRSALRSHETRVRAEYIRALVNSEQVVVNRAYLYNNPAVAQDYLTKSAGREAFKRLLDDGVLVPFLWNESSPVQEPAFGLRDAEQVWPAWAEVAQECRMTCLRLSWDEAANETEARALGAEFSRYAHNLNLIDVPALSRVLDVAETGRERLRERLMDVADFCHAEIRRSGIVRRDDLYREFVVSAGSNPADRVYDRQREFGAEIKQVIDLAYNVNLADRLGAYALTPQGSVPRTALQEWHLKRQAPGQELSPEQLVEIVRRTAFDTVQEGLYLDSFAELWLDDVLALRASASWRRYLNSLQSLLADPDLADPLHFADPQRGAPAVVAAYVAMLREASERAARRKVAARLARWTPGVELFIDVASASLRVLLGPNPVFEVLGEVGSSFANRAAPVVLRLVVNRRTARKEQARLDASLRVLEGRFAGGAQRQWQSLITALRTAGFTEHRELGLPSRTAELTEPGHPA